jgi:hypothetical protein
MGEEVPDWLLFSPSSLEGRSPPFGRLSTGSPVASYAEVVHSKGKAPIEPSGSSVLMDKGKAPMKGHGSGAGRSPSLPVQAANFMANARRASIGQADAPRQQAPDREGWQLVER